MNTFVKIIYYGAFIAIFILALIVYYRLLVLSRQIAKTKIYDKDVSAFYQSAETFFLSASPHFPISALIKILPGTFIGFGILGTFLGFSNGISEMSLTENVDELFGKLDVFFSGLTTAFVTSIIGVILSVLFGTILYQWPLNTIKYHCTRIYREMTEAFAPAETAKNEFNAYIGSLQEMTKTLLSAKDTIQVTMQSTVETIEMLPEKFIEIGKSLEESVAPVKETFGAMQETLKNYSKQASALQTASAQIQTSLTKFIETSEQTTERVNQNLEQAISTTQTIQDSNAKLNEDHRKMLESTFSTYQEIDEKIGSILETVNKNISEYSQTMEKTLIQTLEEYNKTAQKVTEAFFGGQK